MQSLQFHNKKNLYNNTAKLFDQINRRFRRSTCCQQIIYKYNSLTRTDIFFMNLYFRCSIFQSIFPAYRLSWQLALFTDRHKPFILIICKRHTK